MIILFSSVQYFIIAFFVIFICLKSNSFGLLTSPPNLGWNDGKIRAHTPETGKPLYTIENAHQRGVTAIAATSDCMRIISGGGEGDVRVWDVTTSTQVKIIFYLNIFCLS